MSHKRCRVCLEERPVTEYKLHSRKNGRQFYSRQCRLCINQYNREYYSTEEGNRTRKSAKLKHKYGITLEEYEELEAYQCYVCAICEEECSTGEGLSVDHCHDTGVIRGLLCRRCNVAVGVLKTQELMRRATKYLQDAER